MKKVKLNGAVIYVDYDKDSKSAIVKYEVRCNICGKMELLDKVDDRFICDDCMSKFKGLTATKTNKTKITRKHHSKKRGSKLDMYAKMLTVVDVENYVKGTRIKTNMANALFYLVMKHYGTDTIANLTGLKPSSVHTYLMILTRKHLLFSERGSNMFTVMPDVKYIWRS